MIRLTLCVLIAALASLMLAAGPAQASAMPERETVASCYGDELRGSLQANGDPFVPEAFTTAHKFLPLGSQVLVRSGAAWAILTVTDRGPAPPDREFDLSCGAMAFLGLLDQGVAVVEVTEL